MKKSKILLILAALAAVFAFSSCQSAAPLQRDGVTSIPLGSSNYEVLGRVKFVENTTKIHFPILSAFSKGRPVALYYKTLEKAQQEYPTANDVLNITVDYESTTFLIFESGKYTTTGLAVRYTEAK